MDESVTNWVQRFRSGDREAGDELWRRYSSSLMEMARRRYPSVLGAASDEDDLIQSVFLALWKTASQGTLSDIPSRDSFWWLLLAVTRNKVLDRARLAKAKKRSGEIRFGDLDQQVDREAGIADERLPSAELLLALQEEQGRLIGMLRDETLQQIAIHKLEGLTHREIARQTGVSYRSVERKVRLIRDIWLQDANHS